MIRPIVLLIRVILEQRVQQCWNDTERGKPKYWDENPSKCHFVYRKSHMDLRGIEPGPPRERPGTDRLSHLYVNSYKYGDAAKL